MSARHSRDARVTDSVRQADGVGQSRNTLGNKRGTDSYLSSEITIKNQITISSDGVEGLSEPTTMSSSDYFPQRPDMGLPSDIASRRLLSSLRLG